MSWQIGTITLPRSPIKIQHGIAAVVESFPIDGGTALAVGAGLELETLNVDAQIFQSGYSKSQLNGSFIQPLKAYASGTVVISFPSSSFNGTWLMTNFVYEELNEGAMEKYNVLIRFVKGASIVLL